MLLDEERVNLLPYILLPLCGPEEFSEEDMDGMPDDLQFLAPDKKRESDPFILNTLIECLILLCANRPGRETLRRKKVYPIIRELHKALSSNEEIAQSCEKLVEILMRRESE